jgi:hypothetical protein
MVQRRETVATVLRLRGRHPLTYSVRSRVPGEAGGGRPLTWSVPRLARTDAELTSGAPLEAWSEPFEA